MGQTHQFCQLRTHLPRFGIRGVAPAENQVACFLLQGHGKRAGRGQRVRACHQPVGEENTPVSAHGQTLHQGVAGLRWPHGDGQHIGVRLLFELGGPVHSQQVVGVDL